jgi:transcriptional regulator with XRE-family HTH domain
MEAILLKSQKLSHKDICRLTGISPNTLRGYLRAYLKGGIEALKELNLFIKAPSGRERFNVLGASNVVTHELTTVTNDTYINAQSFCDLLWCIARINI